MNFTHFTFAFWCLLVAALLPILCAGLAKSGRFSMPRKQGGYDNHLPREWLSRQTDWRARANAAQANSFEALPFFFIAVILAHALGAVQVRVDILCFLWIVLRVLYVICYVGDMALARAIVWTLALLVNIVVFFVGYY